MELLHKAKIEYTPELHRDKSPANMIASLNELSSVTKKAIERNLESLKASVNQNIENKLKQVESEFTEQIAGIKQMAESVNKSVEKLQYFNQIGY